MELQEMAKTPKFQKRGKKDKELYFTSPLRLMWELGRSEDPLESRISVCNPICSYQSVSSLNFLYLSCQSCNLPCHCPQSSTIWSSQGQLVLKEGRITRIRRASTHAILFANLRELCAPNLKDTMCKT
uniref:Uncharacterized protein n=1 Tax=Arundo donax TaxID=35708 RepID=A0A0A9B9K8_ARUDO